MQRNNLESITQFWIPTEGTDFQQWKPAHTWQEDWQGESHEDIEQELKQRKIKKSDKQDRLRWGHTIKGVFTTKEAYNIRYAPNTNDKDQLWSNIWQLPIWPKVSTFLWLLSKNRILTWDNLQRRGFTGPSQCPNCSLHSETILHLMEYCPLARFLWDNIERCTQRSGNCQADIANLLRTWPKMPYQSPLLNTLWTLIPGFLYWTIWKERNNRVFNSKSRPPDILWTLFKQNIQETLLLRTWQDSDWPSSPFEISVWKSWDIHVSHLSPIASQASRKAVSPSHWSPPTLNTFKLNFDGAAKGNPGPAGFGGAIRNDKGDIQRIFFGSIGHDTNNAAELEGLWTGIGIADQHGYYPLTVEGDSQILINAAIRIQSGTPATKVSSSWRLLRRLESLEVRLKGTNSISFQHVKREANKVADHLANQGVDLNGPPFSGKLNESTNHQLQNDCLSLATQDLLLPDAGVR